MKLDPPAMAQRGKPAPYFKVGSQVRVTTISGVEHHGEVVGFDRETKFLWLKEGQRTGALSTAFQFHSQRVNDINSGELQSLYQWLAELGTPIHEKLGGSLHRVARSVDEEFDEEFGF